MLKQIKGEHLAKILLAGKCNIVVQSLRTKKSINFTINKVEHKAIKEQYGEYVIKVGLIVLGYINKTYQYLTYPKDKPLNLEQEAFAWIWKNQHIPKLLDDKIGIYHTGKCAHCNRPLTDLKSIEIGLGPECLKKLTRN